MNTELEQGNQLTAITVAWQAAPNPKPKDLELAYYNYLQNNLGKPLYLPPSVRNNVTATKAMLDAFYHHGPSDHTYLNAEETASIVDATLLETIRLKTLIAKSGGVKTEADKELYAGSMAALRLIGEIYKPLVLRNPLSADQTDNQFMRALVHTMLDTFKHDGPLSNPRLSHYFSFLSAFVSYNADILAYSMIHGHSRRAVATEKIITEKPVFFHLPTKTADKRRDELKKDFDTNLLPSPDGTNGSSALTLPPSIRNPKSGQNLETAQSALEQALIERAGATTPPNGFSYLAAQIVENIRLSIYMDEFVRPRYEVLTGTDAPVDELIAQLIDGARFVATTAKNHAGKDGRYDTTALEKQSTARDLLNVAYNLFTLDENADGARKASDMMRVLPPEDRKQKPDLTTALIAKLTGYQAQRV